MPKNPFRCKLENLCKCLEKEHAERYAAKETTPAQILLDKMIKYLQVLLILQLVFQAITAFSSVRLLGTKSSQLASTAQSSMVLRASSMGTDEKPDFFKAGLLANLEEEAGILASKKIRSVKDLGWKGPAKRRGGIRPRHWAFGGADEMPVQDKPNYDPASPLCVEKWVSLKEFYGIVKDDTAIADTIYVALAKGGAFVEREVAEDVIASWRPDGKKFDQSAFLKTVQSGRTDFLLGWSIWLFITGFAVTGIIFPTNPLQLALVDFLDTFTNADANLEALAQAKKAGLI